MTHTCLWTRHGYMSGTARGSLAVRAAHYCFQTSFNEQNVPLCSAGPSGSGEAQVVLDVWIAGKSSDGTCLAVQLCIDVHLEVCRETRRCPALHLVPLWLRCPRILHWYLCTMDTCTCGTHQPKNSKLHTKHTSAYLTESYRRLLRAFSSIEHLCFVCCVLAKHLASQGLSVPCTHVAAPKTVQYVALQQRRVRARQIGAQHRCCGFRCKQPHSCCSTNVQSFPVNTIPVHVNKIRHHSGIMRDMTLRATPHKRANSTRAREQTMKSS